MSVLASAWHRTVEIILPARCVGCGTTGTYLCGRCVQSATQALPRVGNAAALDSVVSPFAYVGVARTAVHRLKYGDLRAIAPLMAGPMARALDSVRHVDVLVPVPLHPKRLRERGYNQAGLLAKEIALLIGLAVNERLLSRATQSGHQVDAPSRAARIANVAGAFQASSGVEGLDILLVDDVITTGATLSAVARALKQRGAHEVHALTFASDARASEAGGEALAP